MHSLAQFIPSTSAKITLCKSYNEKSYLAVGVTEDIELEASYINLYEKESFRSVKVKIKKEN